MSTTDREKETRIKYQDIAYQACMALDSALDRKLIHGKGTRAEDIVTSIRTLESQRDAWKAYAYHLESCRECAASEWEICPLASTLRNSAYEPA